MRLLALAACVLATAPALAGRRASFRVGAEVVSSARLSVTPSGAVLGVETRSFGSRSAAVLLAQRSGSPVRLLDGSKLPQEGQRPLVLPAGAEQRLKFAPSSRGAEVVLTLFPDGAPPQRIP